MLATWTFKETSPAAAGTAFSNQPVVGVDAATYGPGIAAPLDDYLELRILAFLKGATGGVLDVYLQAFDGVDWYDYVHFTQLSAGGGSVIYALSTANAPSGIVTVGVNGSPALAANTILGGAWGDRMRLAMVAGSSTSAGASLVVQIQGQRPRGGR
jgi:hypothetical protein